MLKENEEVRFAGCRIIDVLAEVEYMLVSLHKIASYYYSEPNMVDDDHVYKDYAAETTRFIDESKITHRLANMRQILSEPFNNELGADDMGDIERALVNVKCWRKPGD